MAPNPDHPNEFAALRKLLAWKRHELPPPGYFQRLPDRVIDRIEAEGIQPRSAWWERLLHEVRVEPVVAGAYGLLVGGLLILGLSLSEAVQPEESSASVLGSAWFSAVPSSALAPAGPALVVDPPVNPTDGSSSFNPVLGKPSPFSRALAGSANVQRVSVSYQLR
jgi:hypothetical protein